MHVYKKVNLRNIGNDICKIYFLFKKLYKFIPTAVPRRALYENLTHITYYSIHNTVVNSQDAPINYSNLSAHGRAKQRQVKSSLPMDAHFNVGTYITCILHL